MPARTAAGLSSPKGSRLLRSLGVLHKVVKYRRSQLIFAQGGPCNEVMYLQHGSVKLSMLARSGKEAIVSVLEPGDFRKLGLIEYNGGIKIHPALLSVVLHD